MSDASPDDGARMLRTARRGRYDGGRDRQMAEGLEQRLDYTDLAHTPDDGRRYELLDGTLVVSPSPPPLHQRVSKRLQRQLEPYFEDRNLGEVFDAPVDVILGFHDVVVPDLVVVTASQVIDRVIEGAPALIVEVLSLSTSTRDRTVKAHRYAAFGVPHYWIVDPVLKALECYALRQNRYVSILTAKGATLVTHPGWPELAIDLAAIWR